MQNRKVSAKLINVTVERDVYDGAPQGGVVSGNLLWNGEMNDLLLRFPKRDPSDKGSFADDVLALGVGVDANTTISVIQNDVTILTQWAEDHGLTFSPSKTKAMIITRQRNINLGNIYIYDEPVEWVNTYKYLGIMIDNKLTWIQYKEPSRLLCYINLGSSAYCVTMA